MHILLAAAITFLISFDGLKPAQVTPQQAPFLYSLIQKGTSAKYMTPSFPAATFTNHATLITGCTPEEHGIVGNHFIDPKRGNFHMQNDANWLECEPLWAKASAQGIRNASYLWPSTSNDWHGLKPTYAVIPPTKNADTFFKHLDDKMEWQQLYRWASLPADKRPELILGYFTKVDQFGHRFGPSSPTTLEQVKKYDQDLKAFYERVSKLPIGSSINFVIVSDHGMTEGKRPVYLSPILEGLTEKLGDKSWDWMSSSGNLINFYFKNKKDEKIALKFLRQHPLLKVYTNHSLPSNWHYRNPRSGDIVVTLDPPYYLTEKNKKNETVGFHGYDPKNVEMSAFFVAVGPDFTHRKMGIMPNTEIEPMVAKILALNRKKNPASVASTKDKSLKINEN